MSRATTVVTEGGAGASTVVTEHGGRVSTSAGAPAGGLADPRLVGVYVTADWAADPNNPANGGSLPAGVPVIETE